MKFFLAATGDAQFDRLARVAPKHRQRDRITLLADSLAVDFLNDVTGEQAGFFGG